MITCKKIDFLRGCAIMKYMEFVSHSVEDTYQFAAMVAEQLQGNEILLLEGDLGAGKTTFTKGLAKALGIQSTVTSPTFTLMKSYKDGRLPLYHFDLYRVENVDEVEELGLSDYFDAGGVCVIEWNCIPSFPGKVHKIKISEINGVRYFDWRQTEQ